jgi:hypothetical protein
VATRVDVPLPFVAGPRRRTPGPALSHSEVSAKHLPADRATAIGRRIVTDPAFCHAVVPIARLTCRRRQIHDVVLIE